jgi:hypothetical protein
VYPIRTMANLITTNRRRLGCRHGDHVNGVRGSDRGVADAVGAHRTQNAALVSNAATLTSVMAGVSANSITAQNITDINAAIVAVSAAATAYATAFTAGGAGVTRPDTGL